MTYIHQRKVLAYIRENFKFRADRYYYFDMAKIDVDKSIFQFNEFELIQDYKSQCKIAQETDLFHIVVYPNCDNQIMLGVNGDGFDYCENLTTGEIEHDDCSFGSIDPIQLRLDMLQLVRELKEDTGS